MAVFVLDEVAGARALDKVETCVLRALQSADKSGPAPLSENAPHVPLKVIVPPRGGILSGVTYSGSGKAGKSKWMLLMASLEPVFTI